MAEDDVVDRFFDATLDQDDVDYENFLDQGGSEIASAVRVHQLFQQAAKSWREPERPRTLGRFEIVGDLGAGGLGRVYLGWDPELRRHVAIKVIARDNWAMTEARSVAKLDHRSIVKVYEVGHEHLVMELLDGGTLQDKVEDLLEGNQNSLSDPRARLHCLVRIAEGLAYCHDRGILHRDIKPSNVLFPKQDEHPRLIDFGLAHLDESESLDITQNLVGSPAYLAPEQVASGETGTDHRSDIFSFGILAYELLTLHSPFRRDTRTATMAAVEAARPRAARKLNPDISLSMAHIIEHCMEPDPGQRYDSMQEVVQDLQNTLANRPVSVGRRSLLHRTDLFLKRHRQATLFAALGVSLAVIAGVAAWVQSLRSERAAFSAELAGYEDQISGSHSARENTDLGLALFSAKTRAVSLDASPIGRLFFGSQGAVEKTVEHWSRNLAAQLDSIVNFKQRIYPPSGWHGVLNLDEILMPSAPWNAEARSRGRLTIEPALLETGKVTLHKQVGFAANGPKSIERTYEEVPLQKYPDKGFYRVEVQGVWQREFLVESSWCDPIHVAMVEPRLDTRDWFQWEERGLLISPLITNAQYAEFAQKTFLPPIKDWCEGGDPETPYQGAMSRAQKYADWVGGRLPLAEEADTALAIHFNARLEELQGEHVASILPAPGWPLENSSLLIYYRRGKYDHDDWINRLLAFPRTARTKTPALGSPGTFGGYAFRIVYLAPTPNSPDTLKTQPTRTNK